jgi:hypothetical protein
MFAYPSGLGDRLHMAARPDLFVLAALCERAGIDLRIVVLTRPAIEILDTAQAALAAASASASASASGAAAGGPSKENSFVKSVAPELSSLWPQALVDSASVLTSQLQQIDKGFFLCMDYADFGTILSSTAGRWGRMKDKYNSLVDFVHPAMLPDAIKAARAAGVGAAFDNNSSSSSSSSSSVGAGGAESSYLLQSAANSRHFFLFQLEARVRQLAAVCS